MAEAQTAPAATKPNATPPATATGSSTGPDLDTLLKEFTPKPGATAPTPPVTDTAQKLEKALGFIDGIQREREQTALKADVQKMVETVKDTSPVLKDQSDRVVRGMLHDLAAEDPRFAQAFMNRGTNPQAWNDLLKATAKNLEGEFQAKDRGTMERNRLAVEASLRGRQTNIPPEQPMTNADLSKMSEGQFRRYKRNLAASSARR